jgi:hypothetical protein
MTVPHRDDVPRVSARRPYNHDHSAAEETRRYVARLTIVGTVVDPRKRIAREHLASVGEIQPALSQSDRSLHRIEGDLHVN